MKYRFAKADYDFGSRTFLMGVLNITPDSFSDGGKYFDSAVILDKVIEDAIFMQKAGADFIDVGGESTRPGAQKVSIAEELERVVPVVNALSRKLSIPISIDTYKSEVADECLKEGACIVNDISGFRFDKDIAAVTAKHNASCVLMHIKGTPENMQKDPVYNGVVMEVLNYLRTSANIAKEAGISQIIIDPGIGFGKTLEHNLELIRNVGVLRELGYPVLIGLSRKSFIDKIFPTPVDERIFGTISASTVAINCGADILRVHDVNENFKAVKIADKILRI
ncbi:MAG: dihydropteroate synthase [Ignavibacteria bacterium]